MPLTAVGMLAAEFPDWQITPLPGLATPWEAYWQTPDGRPRRTVTLLSAPELLEYLRAIRNDSRER